MVSLSPNHLFKDLVTKSCSKVPSWGGGRIKMEGTQCSPWQYLLVSASLHCRVLGGVCIWFSRW